MAMITITFPNEATREYPKGVKLSEIAASIAPRLAKTALVGIVNGEKLDMTREVHEDARIAFLLGTDDEGLHVLRHSTAHLLAHAIKRLYPEAKFGIGPAIANGFYYDIDCPEVFTPESLQKLEKEMQKIVSEDIPLERIEVSREEALKMFTEAGEIYKVEIINELPADSIITIYREGEFIDLCMGPHVPSTSKIKAFKLQSVAGAYWRGSEKNKMLQRIYGLAFNSKPELEAHVKMLEEAAKRDHRKLGKELELFTLEEEGPGFPFFHPNGMAIRNELENFWRQLHFKFKYQEIKTPVILSRHLWEQSGHWDHYRNNMYFTQIDGEDYAVKPMNCPGSILVYKAKPHSYKEFPMRTCELGLVHRHELSGALHGLMRVRSFTQDDAHIFMLTEQIKDEIQGVIHLFDTVYSVFGLKYHAELSTKPEKAMGNDEVWEVATNALKDALEDYGMPYKINPGDGAFYGPKIDFHLTDSIGRTWQCGTIQLDMLLPEKFDLNYVGEDGQKHRPVMIHRVVYGSIERFIGILIEHYAGAFPVWLAPIQVRILPITTKHVEFAQAFNEKLFELGVRTYVDDRNEKIGYKIREAQVQKTPYTLVIGDKEIETNSVAVRKRGEGDLGSQGMDNFIEMLMAEIKEKK